VSNRLDSPLPDYILNFQNMAKAKAPHPADVHGECRFMDEIAELMLPWGWPRHVGRMYGYLLLAPAPVMLDTMAADLRIAKSNASVAARTLEQFGNARRHSEAGSKRIYYSAPDMLAGPFASKTALFERIVRLLAANEAIGRTTEVNARLEGMADFYRDMRDAVQVVLDKYDTQPDRTPSPLRRQGPSPN
jgi:DNA-binding transcriptional regulator GbsR (MarR family)